MTSWRLFLVGAGLVFVAGCSKNPVQVTPGPAPVATTWIGTFSNANQSGPFALDLVQTGTALKGQVVYQSYQSESFLLRGTVNGNTFHLELDTSRSPYQFTFTIDGTTSPDSGLVGSIALPSANFAANIKCHTVERRPATVEATYDEPLNVKAIVYDGSLLWLSTTDIDYVRMTTAGTLADQVGVRIYGDAYWTSSALAWDGSEIWGTFPGDVSTPGGSIPFDDVLGFNAGGRTGDSLRVWHRSGGLAFDGTDFWSIGGSPLRLYRLSHAGVLADSIPVDVPDAHFLAYKDGHLWTLGWFLKRLYELDARGHAIVVYDLPGQDTPSFEAGIAFEGTHVWYADGRFGYSAISRLTLH